MEEQNISIFEARAALVVLNEEIQTEQGAEAIEVLYEFLAQYKTIK